MKKLFVLPTWILVVLLIPILPSKHTWYKKKFTLVDWSNNSKPLNYLFNLFFWFSIIAYIYLFINLIF